MDSTVPRDPPVANPTPVHQPIDIGAYDSFTTYQPGRQGKGPENVFKLEKPCYVEPDAAYRERSCNAMPWPNYNMA